MIAQHPYIACAVFLLVGGFLGFLACALTTIAREADREDLESRENT